MRGARARALDSNTYTEREYSRWVSLWVYVLGRRVVGGAAVAAPMGDAGDPPEGDAYEEYYNDLAQHDGSGSSRAVSGNLTHDRRAQSSPTPGTPVAAAADGNMDKSITD